MHCERGTRLHAPRRGTEVEQRKRKLRALLRLLVDELSAPSLRRPATLGLRSNSPWLRGHTASVWFRIVPAMIIWSHLALPSFGKEESDAVTSLESQSVRDGIFPTLPN